MSKSVAAGGSTIHLSRKICEDNEVALAAVQLVQQFARRANTYPASRRPAPSTSFAAVRFGPSGLPLPIRDRDPRRVSRERERENESCNFLRTTNQIARYQRESTQRAAPFPRGGWPASTRRPYKLAPLNVWILSRATEATRRDATEDTVLGGQE